MILRNKLKPDGNIDRRKARLIAQGFTQQPGVHFTETFAPVTRISTIRFIAALSARYNSKIKQLDVASAYLNGTLEEEIHMKAPKYFEKFMENLIDLEENIEIGKKATDMLHEFQEGDKVLLLKKSIYGLKQAGRAWYTKLEKTLRKIGTTPTKSDPCLFQMGAGEDVTLIAVYVDDFLIACRKATTIDNLSRKLVEEFEVKDLGCASYCLEVEFQQQEGNVAMHQKGYIQEILHRFNMVDCKPTVNPIDISTKLTKRDDITAEERKLPYREIIGALTYLSTTTRPDIAFAVSALGQFNNNYGLEHWKAAKRILRYLKGTINVGLVYSNKSTPIQGFVDADWGGCVDDRRSQTGYIFMLSECAKEAIYLQRLTRESGFDHLGNLTILCDNRSCIALAGNPTYHARTKHIDIRHHFVRDVLKENLFKVDHISTEEQVADFLQKYFQTRNMYFV